MKENIEAGCTVCFNRATYLVELYSNMELMFTHDPGNVVAQDKSMNVKGKHTSGEMTGLPRCIPKPHDTLQALADCVVEIILRNRVTYIWFRSIECERRARIYKIVFNRALKKYGVQMSFSYYRGIYEALRLHKTESA